MRNRDKVTSIILVILLIYIICNLSAINSFLTFATDETYKEGDTRIVVPEAWNKTGETNLTNESKSDLSITNYYVIWDVFENWPEDHITEISHQKFREIEDGNYEILNSSNIKLSGQYVSKEYFRNPTRDTNTTWDCIGVNYVFTREDVNYALQIHYFTKIDYHNESYIKEVDDRVEDFMANIHNENYNGFISLLTHIWDFINPK